MNALHRSSLFACLAATAVLACGGAVPTPTGPAPDAWGIKPMALKISPAGDKVDFRYRVRDPAKAGTIVNREVQPVLVHASTGTRIELPAQRHVGGARPPLKVEEGKNYFILFDNPGGVVHPGDAVTVLIGTADPLSMTAE